MLSKWKLSSLDHTFHLPASSRARVSAPTMNHPMRSGRGRVGCDGQPGIAGSVLVLAGHRFVAFKKAPALVFHPDWLSPRETLRDLAPMLGRNPPKAVMPLNRDPERADDDRHRGY